MTCDCPDPVVFGHGCQPTIMTTIMTTAEAAKKIRDLCQHINQTRTYRNLTEAIHDPRYTTTSQAARDELHRRHGDTT